MHANTMWQQGKNDNNNEHGFDLVKSSSFLTWLDSWHGWIITSLILRMGSWVCTAWGLMPVTQPAKFKQIPKCVCDSCLREPLQRRLDILAVHMALHLEGGTQGHLGTDSSNAHLS